jgi:hypothetical protein
MRRTARNRRKDRKHGDEKSAIELCHAAVRSVLNTPSVAQFPNDHEIYQGAGL